MISPNNCLVTLNTGFPVHVFYSLTLIPYHGTFVKMLVAKHVVIIDEDPLIAGLGIRIALGGKDDLRDSLLDNAFSLVKDIHKAEFEYESFTNIAKLMSSDEGDFWQNFLYYFVWVCDGSPQAHDYGKQQFSYLLGVYDNKDGLAKSALNVYKRLFIEEIKRWLTEI